VRTYLKEHPEIYARIDTQLRQKLGLTGSKDADVPPVPVNGAVQAAEALKPTARRQ
jgi:recombination protein RecA